MAFSGLVAGALTRTLISASASPTGRMPAATVTLTATSLPETNPTAAPVATEAPAATSFTIKLSATPVSGHPGTTITITARVTSIHDGSPIAGLTCRLRAPTNGEPGLFTTWPTPDATDSSGVATWTAQIPANAPGRYVLEVFAQTPSWSYIARASVYIVS